MLSSVSFVVNIILFKPQSFTENTTEKHRVIFNIFLIFRIYILLTVGKDNKKNNSTRAQLHNATTERKSDGARERGNDDTTSRRHESTRVRGDEMLGELVSCEWYVLIVHFRSFSN